MMTKFSAAAGSPGGGPGGPLSTCGHALRFRVFLASFISTLSLCSLHCSGGDCPTGSSCEPAGGGEGGNGGAGGDGGGQVGGSGGEGGGTPPGCEPVEDEPIGTGCGVFVASGATGDGSQLSPYGTVTKAVAELGSAKRIYICGGDTFTGSIDLSSDVSIYGGMDCGGWVFRSANPKPEIVGTADVPAIAISGSGAGALSFLRVTAADAVTLGESSVAVFVQGAETTIRDCELTARAGATGAPGAPQEKVLTPASANGAPGADGCDGTTMTNVGGDPGLNSCGGPALDGGPGGNGTNSGTGGPAGSGLPAGGSAGLADPLNGGACGNGGVGAPGSVGSPGPGALEAELGNLSEGGFIGAVGGNGLSAGAAGNGGGGGGGANQCAVNPFGAGPGGGGGGAGGCGGNPGNGGGGGGGSFALVSVNASTSLDNVSLGAGAGGVGGVGDAGQEGMDGGSGGNSGDPSDACNGGPGGKGGQGGAGGGGRGGPSVGIAYVGEAPMETGTIDITVAATPATGGLGGNGGGANIGGTGADGLAELRQQWP